MVQDSGNVILVGAGPGDPGLITVKGVSAIGQADCVIYDYLASADLLAYARDDAELIYVGKRAGLDYIPQSDINALLISKASEGKCVVRLKGGDPFIFGRGGEEGQELRKAGIPFEVVPGIPAAVGMAAYTGIPLTDRNHASQVTFVTGHQKNNEPEVNVDWECLAKQPGTLVIYMGCHSIHTTTAELIRFGKDPDTPAAIIQWATTPRQRTLVATLGTLANEMDATGIGSPAMIVIGDVNKLRGDLSWYEEKPLFGKRIIVTRSKSQSSSLVNSLSEHGADVVEVPVISIEPIPDNTLLKRASAKLSNYNWVVFTSANGVHAFMETLAELTLDSRALATCKVAVVGAATAEALSAFGIRYDIRPASANGKAVFEALSSQESLDGKRILMPRSEIAHSDLPDLCASAGAEVDDIPSYRTLAVPFDSDDIREQIKSGLIHGITFTSGSTVKNFLNPIFVDGRPDLEKIAIFSIGPVTSHALSEFEVIPTHQADEATVHGLVQTILRHFARK